MSKSGSKQQKLFIKGMTCTSCEAIISDELKDVKGVKDIKVSVKDQTADFSYQGREADLNKAIDKINQLGYTASTEPFDNNKESVGWQTWLESFLIVAAIILGFRLFMNLGLAEKLNFDMTSVGFGAALGVGVIASLSTCLMVVGAVVVSFATKHKAKGDGFYNQNIRPHLLFHLGRYASFFLLGGALGALGSVIGISNNFLAVFTIAIGAILIWMGLNVLGLASSPSAVGLHLPKSLADKWKQLEDKDHWLTPAALGAVSFVLPCGFTQSMQLYAISTGSFMTGGLTMLFFAVGTTPVLLSLGVAATKASNYKMTSLKKAMGMLVIAFALYVAGNGLAMLGFDTASLLPSSSASTKVATVEDEEQIIEMAVTAGGFKPSTLKVKQGIPVKWVIDGSGISGCTNEIIVPKLNISKKLTRGTNIVKFTPKESGTLAFSCWMGMVRGRIIVEPADTADSGIINTANASTDSDDSTCDIGGADCAGESDDTVLPEPACDGSCGGGCGGGCGRSSCTN